jgi:FkbM family methyltransferase
MSKHAVTHLGIHLPPGETHLQGMMDLSPVWEKRGTYQFHKLEAAMTYIPATRRRLAVDVGAHVGLWSRVLAGMFTAVAAFEPVPVHQELFRLNVTTPNVLLHPVALGPAAGVTRLHIQEANSGATHADVRKAGGLDVPMETLDSYGLEGVDLLKIDCEGAEEGVLRGGVETLRRCRPVVIVEQKYDHAERAGWSRFGAVHFLAGLGWQTEQIISGDYIMVPPG